MFTAIYVADRHVTHAAILSVTLDGVTTEEAVTYHPMRGMFGAITTATGKEHRLFADRVNGPDIARSLGDYSGRTVTKVRLAS